MDQSLGKKRIQEEAFTAVCNSVYSLFRIKTHGQMCIGSKHAVDAITRSLIHELMDTPIRVSQICPGMVNTEFSTVRFDGDKAKADNVYRGVDPLVGQDIGKCERRLCNRASRLMYRYTVQPN